MTEYLNKATEFLFNSLLIGLLHMGRLSPCSVTEAIFPPFRQFTP